MVVNNVSEQLQVLGFSENEARTWLALLPLDAVSAYELAQVSGVPSSKIYQVLARLCEKEAVLQLEEGGKTLYAAQSPREVLGARRAELEGTLKTLEDSLDDIARPARASYIWNLRRKEDLLSRARLLIGSSRRELLLSGYDEELSALGPELDAAHRAGVRIAVVHFGKTCLDCGSLYYHPIEDTLAQEHGGRYFALVADHHTAITATMAPDGTTEGAWSRSPGFVLLAEDYIKHDIYLTKIIKRFEGKLTRTFGKRYALLRDIHSDRDHDHD